MNPHLTFAKKGILIVAAKSINRNHRGKGILSPDTNLLALDIFVMFRSANDAGAITLIRGLYTRDPETNKVDVVKVLAEAVPVGVGGDRFLVGEGV